MRFGPLPRRRGSSSTCKALPGLDNGVRIQRYRIDSLLHQPFSKIGVVRRPLPANADILALGPARGDRFLEQHLDRRVALVEPLGYETGVTIDAQSQLRQII